MANEIEVEITLEEKQALRALTKLTKSTDKFGDEAEKSGKQASRAFDTFKGVLASQALVKGLSVTTQAIKGLFNTFVTEGIAAAQVQEDAINSLNVALRATGEFSEEASQSMQSFASELQQASRFGDEVILQNAALIQSLGTLDQDGLKRATQASIDLASALEIDLTAAAQLVGKAASGEIGSFSRYGLIIEKGATQAETFANALEKIESRFSGAALGKVATYSGLVQQTENTFGDVTEIIGQYVTKNEAVIGVISGVNAALKSSQDFLNGNNDAVTDFVNSAVINLLKGFEFTIKSVDVLNRALGTLPETLNIVGSGIVTGLLLPLVGVEKGINALINSIPFLSEKFGEMSTGVQEVFDAAIESVNTSIEQLGVAFTEDTTLDDAASAVGEFTRTLDKELKKQTAITKKERAKQKDATKKKDDFVKGSLSDLFKFEKNVNQSRAENFKSTLGTIATLSSQNNKTLFAIGKAAAISTATIDGIAAVQKALASAPPPFNFALAGLVGVATAANVAKIGASKPPGFQDGGVVGGFQGATAGSDNQLITARSGELFLNAPQQKELFDIANGSGGGTDMVEAINNLASRPINVSIDGAVLATAIRGLQEDGFLA